MARYIIDPLNGIDNQSGLEGHPWKTLNKGSLTAIAGDFVILRGGIYALGDGGACLRTHNHGQLAAPITFQRYSSENPILKNQGIGIFLDNNYIIFDGLSVINDNQATGMIRGCEASGDPNDVTKNKHHITLKNCTFRNMSIDPNNVSFGIDWQFVSYGRIQTCTIDHVGRPSNVGTESGNGIGLAGGYNIIEDCLIDYCGHAGIFATGATVGRHIIRKNTVIGTWGICGEYLVFGTTYNPLLVEGNIFRHVRTKQENTWLNPCWQQQASRTIFRFNRLYDCSGEGIMVYSNQNYHSKYNRFYNNTIFDVGWGTKEAVPPGYNRGPLTFKEEGTGTSVDNIFKNHIHFGNAMDATNYSGTAAPGQHTEVGVIWNATNPMFVDAPHGDFRLQAGSPAINAGEFLTRAATGGSGRILSIQDALYFCDGWGVADGDYIQLEGRIDTAKIVAVDYANNRITIDKDWQWTAGQGVSLPFSGTRPDIGAYEYSANPDFAMSANPNLVIVTQGQSGTAQIGATAINGFNNPITLGTEGLPAYSVATINPHTINPGQVATLTLGASINTPPGDHPIKVTGEG